MANRISLSHIKRVVSAEQNVITADPFHQGGQGFTNINDGVVVELTQVGTGWLRNYTLTLRPYPVGVIHTSRIVRKIPTTMSDTQSQIWMTLEHSREDQT